jgi:hypothetical protein
MRRDDIGSHPLLCVAVSLIPLSLAIYGTVTGTAVFRNSRRERKNRPFDYWFILAFEYGLFIWLLFMAISK